MNTHLKQTPLPTPSLSLFTKNFSDGTHEINDQSTPTPTFGSLGLQDNFETEPIQQDSTQFHLYEIEQPKVRILIFHFISIMFFYS